MVTIRPASITLVAVVALGFAVRAAAQDNFRIVDPRGGDCKITIGLPNNVDIGQIALSIDNVQVTTLPAKRKGPAAELELREPLHENEILTATIGIAGPTTPAQRVLQARQEPREPLTRCGGDPLATTPDDRAVFEASAYLGRAYDNFSPNQDNHYLHPQEQPGVESRFLAGVEAQYRLIGDKGHTFQIWLASYTLHGVRTADVDCQATPAAAVCRNTATDRERFLEIIEHASSLEAHFDTRVEFLTLQQKSETPIKVYGIVRFGFVDVSGGAGKVHNANSVGAGVIAPAGAFRGSSAQIAWGRSEQFQSNPHGDRLKVNGTLVFDVIPGFKDSVQFWKRLAGSPRVFIAIGVDRNPNGPGPDSVTSYVGIDIDLRRMFFGFGG